jgi:hydroxypyruvate isomerase
MLWSDLPLAERFERAAAAGFSAAELWWPGYDDALELPAITHRTGVQLVLLNFDAGDMAAGDRGLLSDPARVGQFRRNVPIALDVAQACGCHMLNALLGVGPQEQLGHARDQVAWAADQAAVQGTKVMIEAVNSIENGAYLVTSTEAAAEFVRSVDRLNVRLQFDAYHMHRMGEDVVASFERHAELIDHVQIADAPGRGEPGTGDIDFPGFFGALDRRGYRGFVGLEYRPSAGDADASLAWLRSIAA